MKNIFGRSRPFAALFAFMAVITLVLTTQAGCSKGEKTPEEKAKEEAASIQRAQEHFNKGNVLLGNKLYAEAIKEYEESIKLSSKSPEAHSNLGFAYLDKYNAEKEKDPSILDKSLEHQRKAADLNPNMAVAYYGIAMALERKGDALGALDNWRQFLKLSPPHTKWWDTAQKSIKAIEDAIKKAAKEAKKTPKKAPKK